MFRAVFQYFHLLERFQTAFKFWQRKCIKCIVHYSSLLLAALTMPICIVMQDMISSVWKQFDKGHVDEVK